MTKPIRIDFVADISCPFCAIAVTSFGEALRNVGDSVNLDLRFQPFELNPQMQPQGQNFLDYLSVKSGATRDQVQARIAALSARAADAGFTISMGEASRIYNTFDAHQLLHWAGLKGKQHQLEQMLFAAYFSEGRDVSSQDVLVDVASSVGLDAETAREVLTSRQYAEDVRATEQHWKSRGVTSVPSIFVDGEVAFSGAQTAAMFEEALRNLSHSEQEVTITTATLAPGAEPIGHDGAGEWLQTRPGERCKIRVSAAETNGAYSVVEIISSPGDSTPMHVHQNEDEHFLVLEGTARIACGDKTVDAVAGTALTLPRNIPHAWGNPTKSPLRVVVTTTPGGVEEILRLIAGRSEIDIMALAAKFSVQVVGPLLLQA